MDWLNYHHLYYFWVVAKERSISKATKRLLIAQPTISAQLKSLESHAGCSLFDRSSKGVKLTREGNIVFGYANKIFQTGLELKSFLSDSREEMPQPVRIGIENHIPKLLSFEIVQPLFTQVKNLKLFCIEDDIQTLVQKILNDDLDFVLCGRKIVTYKSIHVRNHLIGTTDVVWLGSKSLRDKHKTHFPKCMGDVPLILPSEDAELRSQIDQWFESQNIKPRIVAEVQDTALMKVFASNGLGFFPISSSVARAVEKQYRLYRLGRSPEIKQQTYLVTLEKKLHTPAIKLAFESAKTVLEKQE